MIRSEIREFDVKITMIHGILTKNREWYILLIYGFTKSRQKTHCIAEKRV